MKLIFRVPIVGKILIERKKKKLKNQLIMLRSVVRDIDVLLDVMKFNRNLKRSFWEDFYKHKAFREDVFDKLIEQRTNRL